MILAFSCEPTEQPLCIPGNILELFQLPPIFGEWSRTAIYIILAAVVVIGVLYFAYRKPRLVPSKFGTAVEVWSTWSATTSRSESSGPVVSKYAPYLLSLFMFILVGNFFEDHPVHHVPDRFTDGDPSSSPLPPTSSSCSWDSRSGSGLPGASPLAPRRPHRSQAPHRSDRIRLGPDRRPFSLAVRLFANLVAGHTMLALLLGSGVFFVLRRRHRDDRPVKASWSGRSGSLFGMAIFVLDLLILFLQAYIFTLLSAVYIESSLHPAH
jgi:F-type H+-transporting ATPase subunit a